MTHHWNAGAQDALNRLAHFGAALELHAVGMCFLHDADSRSQSLFRVALVCSERHVYNHERAVHATHHRLAVINHLVERHRQSGHVSSHHVAGGVAHENHVHSSLVDEFRHREIVGCKHRYFFSALLHFEQAASSHFPFVFCVS